MEITGKIIRVLEPQQGESKSSGKPWKKREYVMEVANGTYAPRQVFFHFFGDRADQFVLKGGEEYTVSFDIESREFNGRWYTDVRAWKAEPAGASSPQVKTATPEVHDMGKDPFGPDAPVANDFNDSPTDDLPF